MSNTQHHQPIPATLTIATSAVGVVATGLLIAGTAEGRPYLMAWGLVCTMIAVGLGVLCAVRCMVEAAVAGSVDRTAVKVSGAIAEALQPEQAPPRDDDGTVRIYS